jgi:MFS family permease
VNTNNEKSNQSSRDDLEKRNLLVLAGHNILLRLAWIFKTETVIMPAFLDVISGAGWVRGWLPILNRIGQSIPPILCSATLKNSEKKVTMLFVTTLLMGLFFGIIAIGCTQLGQREMPWFPLLFLVLYALFFAATGVNQLAFNTLQGKLVRPFRRGRLMSLAGMMGSIVAIIAALLLLARWLAVPDGRGYAYIFGFTSCGFLVSALFLVLIKEPPDKRGTDRAHPVLLLKNSWATFREDRRFRRVAWVASLFMTSLLLFPHYQWLGRVKLNAGATDLMTWVVVQNASVGIISLLAGYFADRMGNRLIIRVQIFLAASIPLIALALSASSHPQARTIYSLTFFMLGLCPVIMKSMINYALELAREEDHPRYLSTLSLCMAIPLFFSPLVGWLVDWNYKLVFVAISVLVLIAGLLTFRMDEPRNDQIHDDVNL